MDARVTGGNWNGMELAHGLISRVGWLGWPGWATGKRKNKKKKTQKKIRQKVCMSLGCRTGEMGCASQSPRNPAPLQDAVPTAHCPIVRHECIMYSTVEYMYCIGRLPPSVFRHASQAPSTQSRSRLKRARIPYRRIRDQSVPMTLQLKGRGAKENSSLRFDACRRSLLAARRRGLCPLAASAGCKRAGRPCRSRLCREVASSVL